MDSGRTSLFSVISWEFVRPAMGLQANSWDEFVHEDPMRKFLALMTLAVVIVFGVGALISRARKEGAD
jgi:hypothetical protein